MTPLFRPPAPTPSAIRDGARKHKRLGLPRAAVLAGFSLLLLPGCRPGGFGPGSPARALRFLDRSEDCGVTFTCVSGGREKDWILETNGGGCALFDADGDGDLEIFFVSGARFEDDPANRPGQEPSDTLYRNDGGWKFTDITEEAGLREKAWGGACTVGDVDNDGDLDLFVANFGPDELWINDGRGHFRAEAARRGIRDDGWGSGCAFLDYDRDGWIDLVVVDYLEFHREQIKPRGENGILYKGQPILVGPVGLPMEPCTLWHNRGDGTFVDASHEAGIDVKKAYGLGAAVGDYDADGWPDLYISSDTRDNLLFHNRRDGTFEEVGLESGVARNDMAVAQAGMGVEFVFLRGDAREDLFVLNYEDDTNTFYANEGNGFFTETTSEMGLGAPCFKYLGWACLFADFDLDGDLDLFVSQGHVVPQVDAVASSPGYRQPNMLFLNDGSGKFTDDSERAGPGLRPKKSSRGAAYGDLDGDGDLDLVVNDIDERATVIECEGAPLGHWLAVRLVGTRSNRAAIDAVIRLKAAGRRQARRVRSAVGYASSSELTQRFGLGAASGVEELEVAWPSGRRERFEVEGIDRVVRLREGEGVKVSEARAAEGDRNAKATRAAPAGK